MGRTKQITFRDYRLNRGRGGPRSGSGRPARRPGIVHHVRRPKVGRSYPANVTLRVLEGVPSLRKREFVADFRASLVRAMKRNEESGGFRVAHYSIQGNHVHLIVEAVTKEALGRGMKSISTRLVWAARRVFGISGRVLDGRYHLRLLKTPREVRHALAYVLLNARKHFRRLRRLAPRLDEASSARWFDGWRREERGLVLKRVRMGDREVSEPHTWLLRSGWRKHRLISISEVPGAG